MRILLLFILLIFSFSFAQVCSVSSCEENGAFICKSDSDANILRFTESFSDLKNSCKINYGGELRRYKPVVFGNIIQCYYDNALYFPEQSNLTLMGTTRASGVYAPYCSSIPEPPQMCSATLFCSGADANKWNDLQWYESCDSSFTQSINVSSQGGDFGITYGCKNPPRTSSICFKFTEDIPCDEIPPEDHVFPEDIPSHEEVPCYGDGCHSDKPGMPDYVDPDTGVPCWSSLGAEGCIGSVPDSVGPDGVPCWGDNCGSSPPVFTNPDGSICLGNNCGTGNGGGDGGTGGTGNGGGDGGTGNGGGDGGAGNGGGDGDGNDWGVCPPSGCGLGSGLIDGSGFAQIPETFHKPKYKEDALKQALDNYMNNKPMDFESINTDLGVAAVCPVTWSVPFLHGTSINISIPCSVFAQLKTFFIFLSYLFGFYHIFRKRS